MNRVNRLGDLDLDELDQFYSNYYRKQSGNGYGIPVYKGRRVVKGGGIGNMFKGLLKSIKPTLIAGTKKIGSSVLKTLGNVAVDALDGKNIGKSFENRFKDTGKRMLQDVLSSNNPKKRTKKQQNRRVKRLKREKTIF